MKPAHTLAIRTLAFLSFACLALATGRAMGQAAGTPQKPDASPRAEDEPKSIVRVYPVQDLIFERKDYPFNPVIPTTVPLDGSESKSTPSGGGGAGIGGGLGGGMFSVAVPESAYFLRQVGKPGAAANPPAASGRPLQAPTQADKLLQLVATVVHADADPDNAAEDHICRLFGGRLIVRHTEEGQRQVAALLSALRSGGSAARSVTVDATWLILDSKQREVMRSLRSPSATSANRLDAKRFVELARQATAFHGRITCLDGQKVHLATGGRHVLAAGAIPTVGVGSMGYSMTTRIVNIGAVLQVTPSVGTGNEAAFLDLQSVVTQWRAPGEPIKVTSHSFAGSSDKKGEGPLVHDSVSVDRANIGTQEWSTTVSIPLREPVLVGSTTLTNPDDKSGKLSAGDHPELALVIEVRAN